MLKNPFRLMLNLEPLVARFVDELLRTLRRASIDELCDALKTTEPSAPAAPTHPSVRSVEQQQPVHSTPAPRAERRRPVRRKVVVVPAAPSSHPASHEPHAVGEITEPERLLAVALESLPAAPAPTQDVEDPPADAPPESGERTTASHPPRLRHGEAAVAVKGSTFVIRRAKRA